MSGLMAGVIMGLSALYGGKPGYFVWLVCFILFLSWLRPFSRQIVAILISVALGVLIANVPSMLSTQSANQIGTEATLEDHSGTTSVKVTLKGEPNGFAYIVRLIKCTEYTDWYEQKSVTSEDLADGSEIIWFPMSIPGNASGTEPSSIDSVRVEVIEQTAGTLIYSNYLWPQPEDVQVIPVTSAQNNEIELDGVWPTSGHDWQRSGSSPYVGPKAPHLLWKYTESLDATPFVGPDGTIYFGRYYLFAVNPDGSTKWVFKRMAHELAIAANGTIYFGSERSGYGDWCIYAVGADGGLRWSLPTDGDPNFLAPAIGSDGTIYVASAFYDERAETSHLYSIAPNGTLKWDFLVDGQISGSPAIGTDGTILFTCPTSSGMDKLYALKPDGSMEWTYPIEGEIAVSLDGTIYVVEGNLYALNPDGSLKWQNRDIQLGSTLAVGHDGSVYVGTSNGKVQAVAADGYIKWSFATKGGLVVQPLVDCNGTVYVRANGDNNLYALDSSGNLEWKFDMGSPTQRQVAMDSNGTIYTNSGYAFGSEP